MSQAAEGFFPAVEAGEYGCDVYGVMSCCVCHRFLSCWVKVVGPADFFINRKDTFRVDGGGEVCQGVAFSRAGYAQQCCPVSNQAAQARCQRFRLS